MNKRFALTTLAPWLQSACSSTKLDNPWSAPRFTSQPWRHVREFSKSKDIVKLIEGNLMRSPVLGRCAARHRLRAQRCGMSLAP